jgi:hypothetical protein
MLRFYQYILKKYTFFVLFIQNHHDILSFFSHDFHRKSLKQHVVSGFF